jgi:hypothetical protein
VIGQTEIEEISGACRIEPWPESGQRQELLDLGRAGDPPVRSIDIQRLDAEPVTGNEQPAGIGIELGERKHSLETFECTHAPGFERCEHQPRV